MSYPLVVINARRRKEGAEQNSGERCSTVVSTVVSLSGPVLDKEQREVKPFKKLDCGETALPVNTSLVQSTNGHSLSIGESTEGNEATSGSLFHDGAACPQVIITVPMGIYSDASSQGITVRGVGYGASSTEECLPNGSVNKVQEPTEHITAVGSMVVFDDYEAFTVNTDCIECSEIPSCYAQATTISSGVMGMTVRESSHKTASGSANEVLQHCTDFATTIGNVVDFEAFPVNVDCIECSEIPSCFEQATTISSGVMGMTVRGSSHETASTEECLPNVIYEANTVSEGIQCSDECVYSFSGRSTGRTISRTAILLLPSNTGSSPIKPMFLC